METMSSEGRRRAASVGGSRLQLPQRALSRFDHYFRKPVMNNNCTRFDILSQVFDLITGLFTKPAGRVPNTFGENQIQSKKAVPLVFCASATLSKQSSSQNVLLCTTQLLVNAESEMV